MLGPHCCRDFSLLVIGGYFLVADHGLYGLWSSVVAARGFSSCGSRGLQHRLNSCGAEACGIFLDQGLNMYLLNRQVDSLPLSHQGSCYEKILSRDCNFSVFLEKYAQCRYITIIWEFISLQIYQIPQPYPKVFWFGRSDKVRESAFKISTQSLFGYKWFMDYNLREYTWSWGP